MLCVGLLVEEEEVSVSKISRREKGVSFVRSFVSDCNAVETGCQITCLGSLADIGEPFKERCIITSLQRLFRRLKPEVFFGIFFLALLRSWEEIKILPM